MRKYLCVILLALAGCSSPERQSAEAVAKRNPLDMANEDAKTIVVKRVDKPPKYPKVPTVDSQSAAYISGKSSKIYHLRGCDYAGKPDSPVGFATWADAEKSGRIPCEFCKPHENSSTAK